MDKTKIEWCDSTWNPVTGCKHDCGYCYARTIAERFRGRGDLREAGTGFWLDKDIFEVSRGSGVYETRYALTTGEKPEPFKPYNGKITPYPFGFSPTFHRYRLEEYEKKTGRTIFACSMADLFGSWVPDSWIEEIFSACEKAPQHNYLFLTKNPQRYADLDCADKLPIRDNMWYGTSITNAEQMKQAADTFGQLPTRAKTFFSIEPILEDIAATSGWTFADNGNYANWIIVGAETGRRKEKVVPERSWIEKITTDCDDGGIPLFMKDSLIPVVGEDDMRREFPRELRRTP